MADRGLKLLVGVSGGPDSISLLHALNRVSNDMGFNLCAAHLNHSFRGNESDEDAEYVRDFTASLGIECIIEKIDVPAASIDLRMSHELAAREIRYSFLNRIADQVGADRIALAHTADDKIETCLLNLLRGTGIDGLAGIPPVRDNIIRPMINTRRCDVEEYIKKYELHPRIDSTNLEPIYRRNKIRLELLPYLRHQYNSDIDNLILRLAELAGDDSTYLNSESDKIFTNIQLGSDENTISISVKSLLFHSIALKRRIIRQALRTLMGEITDIGYIHIESILDLLNTGVNFSLDLPGDIFVTRSYDNLTFANCAADDKAVSYSYPIAIPGETKIPEIGALLQTVICNEPIDYKRVNRSSDIVLDLDSICGDLYVRNWHPGDRIYPLGLDGSKKVQDIFSDMKIPKCDRSRIPVITDTEKIIWIAGVLMSESVKVTQETHKYLRIIILMH